MLELNIKDFNFVKDGKVPKDGEFCILVFGKDYNISFGGYSEKEKHFYCNAGLGGIVLNLKDCIAWKNIEEIKAKEI